MSLFGDSSYWQVQKKNGCSQGQTMLAYLGTSFTTHDFSPPITNTNTQNNTQYNTPPP